MPRFSIVVPAYNAGATLAETLDAVLAQECSDWECLVVDDGSTDETAAVAERRVARDSRFRLMQQDNQGTAGAYLTGVTAAAADLLVVCSADDVLLPAHLETMDAFIRANPHHEIYSSNGFYLYEESGRHTTVYTGCKWRRERSLTFEEVVARCFYSVGVVFRRRVYESTGGHRPGAFAEDYDLWLRAMVRGARHFYVPRILSVHRVFDSQKTADLAGVFASNIEVCRNLLTDDAMGPAKRRAVEKAIALNRRRMDDCSAEQALRHQSQSLRATMERFVGARCSETLIGGVHRVSWMSRPARRAVARRRARKP